MTLDQIIQLSVNDSFKYNGQLAKVIWTEFNSELVETTKDGKKLYLNDFNMYFELENTGITIHSGHPNPKVLKLDEFSE